MGHRIQCIDYIWSDVQAISVNKEKQLIQSSCDDRKGGQPDGL